MSHPIRVSASRLKTLKDCTLLFWYTEVQRLPENTHWKTIIRCPIGVYVDTMWIYLITCLVNGKHYVGRTKRANPNKRWTEHKSAARRGKKHGIIPRAIRKHGEHCFTFEPIERVARLEDLPEREAFWIMSYGSLAPKGYNLETYQPNRVLTAESCMRLSRAQQGRKKCSTSTSRYVGVHRHRYGWAALLTFRGVDYWHLFPTERAAALGYDQIARYVCGSEATVNDPRCVHTEGELKAAHALFTAPKHTSRYQGVHLSQTLGKWKGTVRLPNGTTRVRVTDNETEAAQFVDVVRTIYLDASADTLNYPERYAQYRALDEAWLNARACIPSSKGVTKRGNRYLGRLGNGGKLWSGSFGSYEEAATAVATKRRELGMTWDL